MYGIIETYKPHDLIGKRVFLFVKPCQPNHFMNPQTWGGNGVPISEGEVLERWKTFFRSKNVPFFIKKSRNGSLTLWKEEIAWESTKDQTAILCEAEWFERGRN